MRTAKGHFELSDLLSTPHNKPHPKYSFLTNIFTTIIVPVSCHLPKQHIQIQLFKEFHVQMISHVSCYIILTVLHHERAEVLNKKARRRSLEEKHEEMTHF